MEEDVWEPTVVAATVATDGGETKLCRRYCENALLVFSPSLSRTNLFSRDRQNWLVYVQVRDQESEVRNSQWT